MNNIPTSITEKISLKLHRNIQHPIGQLKTIVETHFKNQGFAAFDNISEIVTVKQNFNDLLIPVDHPSRRITDTYYVDDDHVLRTHTSAHQGELMKKHCRFIVTGDVYRKDTIDKSHYPIFHQVEGVKIFMGTARDAEEDLRTTLAKLICELFPRVEYRFLSDYFPFTHPSLQVEIKLEDGSYMEVLGGGVIRPEILEANGQLHNGKCTGWAFGLGLDRLVMKKCNIPDIRYLWSNDEKFIKQFKNGLTQFEEYSKYPSTYRDISFWTNHDLNNLTWNNHNDFCELCREIGKDIIESITQKDYYIKDDKISFLYRIEYRSNDRTLTNEEINELDTKIRNSMVSKFDLILR